MTYADAFRQHSLDMAIFELAASEVVSAWSDVHVRGYLKDHPDLVGAACDKLAGLLREMRVHIRKEKARGHWGELPVDEYPPGKHLEETAVGMVDDHGPCCCHYCRFARGCEREKSSAIGTYRIPPDRFAEFQVSGDGIPADVKLTPAQRKVLRDFMTRGDT